VPIFIPFHGCPHRCVFCQQEKITSQSASSLDKSEMNKVLDRAVQSPAFDPERRPQVAFYGGTFTSLPIEDMTALLKLVDPYIQKGYFRSIRISTRPDALDARRMDLLKRFNVTTVELGAQSMDQKVLDLSRRGHRTQDTVRAVNDLKQSGFRVGIQLMPGLPGDSAATFFTGVEKVIHLRPDMVRLYPTIVIKETVLAQMFEENRYTPLGLDEALNICAESCERFESHGIPVIRIGLMSSPHLLQEGQIVAGPWHGAFGYLVRSMILHKKIEPLLPRQGEANRILLRVVPHEIPLIRGNKNIGILLIEQKTGAKVTKILPDQHVPPGTIRVEKVE